MLRKAWILCLIIGVFLWGSKALPAAVPSAELRNLQRQQDQILQQQEERLRMQEEELRRRGGPSATITPDLFEHVPGAPDAACTEVGNSRGAKRLRGQIFDSHRIQRWFARH